MLKSVKPIFYLAAAVLIVAVVAVVLIKKDGKPLSPPPTAQDFEPISGAQANSYEVASEVWESSAADLLIGSQEAPLKILVYEDYASSFSAQLAETLSQLRGEYSDKIALIVRPFAQVASPASWEAAIFYTCAQEEGKGEDARRLLLTAAQSGGLAADGYMAAAEELKINGNKFNACLTNPDKSVKLEEDLAVARRALVLGAPTIFVGDEMILGARPYADFVDSNGDAIEGLKTVVARRLGE